MPRPRARSGHGNFEPRSSKPSKIDSAQPFTIENLYQKKFVAIFRAEIRFFGKKGGKKKKEL